MCSQMYLGKRQYCGSLVLNDPLHNLVLVLSLHQVARCPGSLSSTPNDQRFFEHFCGWAGLAILLSSQARLGLDTCTGIWRTHNAPNMQPAGLRTQEYTESWLAAPCLKTKLL